MPGGRSRAWTEADGQVFVNVSAEDLASYLLDSTSMGFGDGARPAEAAIRDDRFLLRTKLRVADLGLDDVPFLGRVAATTATVVIGGTLSVERPGLGEWHVKSIDVRRDRGARGGDPARDARRGEPRAARRHA